MVVLEEKKFPYQFSQSCIDVWNLLFADSFCLIPIVYAGSQRSKNGITATLWCLARQSGLHRVRDIVDVSRIQTLKI
jgi:hypothetical protein